MTGRGFGVGRCVLVLLTAACPLWACDGGAPPEEAEPRSERSARFPTSDAGREQPSGGPDERLPEDSLPLARMLGTVTRSAEIQEDAVGDLYVALFDANPVALAATESPTRSAKSGGGR